MGWGFYRVSPNETEGRTPCMLCRNEKGLMRCSRRRRDMREGGEVFLGCRDGGGPHASENVGRVGGLMTQCHESEGLVRQMS